MIQNIMVPLAFSRYSQGLLEYAADMATSLGAHLYVVNVINGRNLEAVELINHHGYKVDSESYTELILEDRRRKMDEMLAPLTLDDEKVTIAFRIGEPADELLRFVLEEQIDVVVMGVKTRDIQHMFTGSVAERLFRRCPCTIVSYRDKEISQRLKKRIERHLHL
ncbi:MAG: hypothetical protein CSA34_00100 [Desulfobulbus propionicus]|nr:MAG: hypothetical protein CSA34_00100 [Desulfobulbus propionicus]